MAIYRTVQTSFWTDRKVDEDFTPEDKYFYLYLFTNPHTNLTGCYELGIKQASYEMGYNKDTIERLIKRFREVHKIIDYCEETNEILVINWHKYNWNKSQDFLKGLDKQIEKVKNKKFKQYLKDLRTNDETIYRQSIDGLEITVTDTVTDIVADTKHKYGLYKNVLLTNDQLEKIKKEFPNDWEERIERVSEYCASTGKKYKDYLATIRNWARNEKQKIEPAKHVGRVEEYNATYDASKNNNLSEEELNELLSMRNK